MKYTLEYQYGGEGSSTELAGDGIYYVAFGAEGVHVFGNPTRGQHVILIVERGSFFAVFDGEARAVEFNESHAFGELTLSVKPDSAMHPRFVHFTKALASRRSTVIAVGAGVVLLIVLVAFVGYLRIGGDEEITTVAMETVSSGVNERTNAKGSEVAELRFKLAGRALDEGQPLKALEIADKMLAADPENAQAKELRDRALRLSEGAKQKGKERLSQDVWAQQMISEASRMMAAGDYTGARFTLRQVLDADPDNARAVEMGRKIDGHLKALTNDRASEEKMRDVATAEARSSFEKGRVLKAEGKTVEAYRAFKAAVDALRKYEAHPDYEILLNGEYEEARAQVAGEAKQLMAQAEESFNRGNKGGGSAVRAQHYRRAMDTIMKAEDMYEEVDAKELRQDILSAFTEALEPLYVEAITLQELEGCCFANAKLMEIKQLAKFPEVHHYEASVAAMNRCPCKR